MEATVQRDTFWDRFARFIGWEREGIVLYFLLIGITLIGGYLTFGQLFSFLSFWVSSFWQGLSFRSFDWLFLIIWVVIYSLVRRNVDLKHDLPLYFVCVVGGIIAEAWGTQTGIWIYFTGQDPPPWIIPAWPFTGIAISHLARNIDRKLPSISERWLKVGYWVIMPTFWPVLFLFTDHTLHMPLTWVVLTAAVLGVVFPINSKYMRLALITYIAGSAAGYFLEFWGTSRLCWEYYNGAVPPLFAPLAHGYAGLVFMKVVVFITWLFDKAGIDWIQRLDKANQTM